MDISLLLPKGVKIMMQLINVIYGHKELLAIFFFKVIKNVEFH